MKVKDLQAQHDYKSDNIMNRLKGASICCNN